MAKRKTTPVPEIRSADDHVTAIVGFGTAEQAQEYANHITTAVLYEIADLVHVEIVSEWTPKATVAKRVVAKARA